MPFGGVVWYGVDDSYVTCYVPLYCSIDRIPKPFTIGDIQKFSMESAWWVFNMTANYVNLKYSYMIKDMQAVQSELEDKAIANDADVIKNGALLLKQSKKKTVKYLTDYSSQHCNLVIKRWLELYAALNVKYNDGYVKDNKGEDPIRGLSRRLEEEGHRFKSAAT